MTNQEAIGMLNKWYGLFPSEAYEALDIAIKALEDIERWRTWSHTYDDLISRQSALDAIGHDPNDTYDEIKSLPSRLTEYKTFCGVPIEEAVRVIQEYNAKPKTGKWKLDPNGMDWNIPAWRCSECGFVANYIGVEANGLGNNPMNWAGSKFCPQCGARIIGYER